MPRRTPPLPFSMLVIFALVGACGDDVGMVADSGTDAMDAMDSMMPDVGPPMDWPGMEVPAATVPSPGVRRELFLVRGTTPPANAVTMAATPSEFNNTQVVRYRQDADTPVAARAILVAMPGFLGGGPSFETLAHELVKRGAESGEALEVWAIDRRSNQLEDLRGMDTAEAAGNPEIAQGYYFGRETIDGERFGGFRTAAELSYMSEWGLATHAEDLRRVIALVPEAQRQGHVFLMGHSLGASFTEAYASWRFEDGTRGVEELAGLILIDGGLRGEATTEEAYREGSGGLTGGPGLDAIRASTPLTALPLLGLDIYARAEIMGLRTLTDPTAVMADPGRDRVLSLLLGTSPIPAMTNQGAFGWGFDSASNPFSFAAASCGQATGGATASYDNPFGDGTLLQPADADATYDWIDARDASPPEATPIAALATSWSHGRSNFAEWYFPSRLPLDIGAVGGADVPEDGWQAGEGLRAFDRELVDAPVLAVAAALVGVTGYETLATRMAPAIGAGRRNEGATRDDELGLRIIDNASQAHLDPLVGIETDENTSALEIERFVGEHAAEAETVTIPVM